ncbi:hypothetical protein [uncultured Rhodoblastus sp.]|uniref:hypothetical protein n=1 Tax=uncultured Rhodoblastus sp. TaxID=543037 RepID=UPI0025FC705A|nr:hypothetical protein [uncultured Rhodoblastus sp.]
MVDTNNLGGIEDLDPGAPQAPVELNAEALQRANFGSDGSGDVPPGVEAFEDLGHPAQLQIDIGKAHNFLVACMNAHPRVKYGLGAKAPFNGAPGVDFKAVDCSGFVREAIRRSTNLGNSFPDGSVVQHEWIESRDFKQVNRATGSAPDGAVRIAFLSPSDSSEGIGHVVLIHNGKTLESHGGVGPDERPWTSRGWQAKASVYLLKP